MRNYKQLIHSGLATEGLVKVEVYDTVIPSSISIGGSVQRAADKNDLSEETLHGEKHHPCHKSGCLPKKELWSRPPFYSENVHELRGMNAQLTEEGLLLITAPTQLMRNG